MSRWSSGSLLLGATYAACAERGRVGGLDGFEAFGHLYECAGLEGDVLAAR